VFHRRELLAGFKLEPAYQKTHNEITFKAVSSLLRNVADCMDFFTDVLEIQKLL